MPGHVCCMGRSSLGPGVCECEDAEQSVANDAWITICLDTEHF